MLYTRRTISATEKPIFYIIDFGKTWRCYINFTKASSSMLSKIIQACTCTFRLTVETRFGSNILNSHTNVPFNPAHSHQTVGTLSCLKCWETLVKAYFRTIRSESVVFTWITKTTLISNVVIATISISNILTCMHGTQIDKRNSKVRSIVQFKPFKFEVFIFEYSSTFVD